MFSISLLSQFIEWMIIAALAVTAAFMLFMVYRRIMRNRYYAAKDGARIRFQTAVANCLNGQISVPTAGRRIGRLQTPAERDALEQLLFARLTPENTETVSELLLAHGFVLRWSQRGFGKKLGRKLTADVAKGRACSSVKNVRQYLASGWLQRRRIFSVHRAVVLNKLGRLSPRHASHFLAAALADPSEIVRRLAIERMGENSFPGAIPLLLEELRRAVEEGNDVSLRTIKSALIHYRMEDMNAFLPFMRHPARRMRFFVVDTLREICHRQSHHQSNDQLLGEARFSAELRAELLQTCCRDEFADVRASCAGVVRHFKTPEAVAALRELLVDESELVRENAVRACAHPWFVQQEHAAYGFSNLFFADLLPDLLKRVTDLRWRVREAAVIALTSLEPDGLTELCHFFASSSDRYACEQVAEEFQRRGLVARMVVGLPTAAGATTLHLAVCRKLLSMGQTSMMIAAIGAVTSPELRISFTESLAVAPEQEIMKVLQEIAHPRPESEHGGALQLLYRFGGQPPVSAARMA